MFANLVMFTPPTMMKSGYILYTYGQLRTICKADIREYIYARDERRSDHQSLHVSKPQSCLCRGIARR
ncbi:hypothetical protein CUJ84_pRLN1000572 (plasmid) [Rhizobium leguminosarum]|uniref:Uncharacterized protein n=1 Tax=Rhizobium leguminosarum TaxID=384 RepID=A0A2K9ZCR0_RHILE|nr:hypothetical protein CUJ84_pRLN1000572 [Rhizobium leguminosarum]